MTYSAGTTLLHTMQDGSFAVLFLLILPFSGMTLCKFLNKIKTVSFTVVSHMQLWNSQITLKEWGLGPHHRTSRWIYTVVIRFILSYSVRIWIRAAFNKTNRTKRERVQAIALRTMIGAYRASPPVLETALPTIITFLRGEAAKGATAYKGTETGSWNHLPLPKAPLMPTITSTTSFLKTFLNPTI